MSRHRLSDSAAFMLPVILLVVLLLWLPYVGLGAGVVVLVLGAGARSLTLGGGYGLPRIRSAAPAEPASDAS